MLSIMIISHTKSRSKAIKENWAWMHYWFKIMTINNYNRHETNSMSFYSVLTTTAIPCRVILFVPRLRPHSKRIASAYNENLKYFNNSAEPISIEKIIA